MNLPSIQKWSAICTQWCRVEHCVKTCISAITWNAQLTPQCTMRNNPSRERDGGKQHMFGNYFFLLWITSMDRPYRNHGSRSTYNLQLSSIFLDSRRPIAALTVSTNLSVSIYSISKHVKTLWIQTSHVLVWEVVLGRFAHYRNRNDDSLDSCTSTGRKQSFLWPARAEVYWQWVLKFLDFRP